MLVSALAARAERRADEALVPPLRAAVDLQGVVAEMREPTISGSCGACHAQGSAVGSVTPGR